MTNRICVAAADLERRCRTNPSSEKATRTNAMERMLAVATGLFFAYSTILRVGDVIVWTSMSLWWTVSLPGSCSGLVCHTAVRH